MPLFQPSARRGFASALVCALLACDGVPQGAQKAWSPEDHDRGKSGRRVSPEPTRDGPSKPQQAPAARGTGTTSASGDAKEEARKFADMTWQNQCASCHGIAGAGDGPMAKVNGAPPLQGKNLSEEAIRTIVRQGRGKMPKYDVDDAVLEALVVKVRGL
jgi:mono/diheme cytochrome c family protein